MGIASKGLQSRPIFVNQAYRISGKKNGDKEILSELRQYYSQVDAEIFFGNYYVEDVLLLQFGISQKTMPVYGYNSWVMDAAIQGSRIIQGSFAINFTAPGYLGRLLEKIATEEKKEKDAASQALWPVLFDIDIAYGQKTKQTQIAHIVLANVTIADMGTMVHGGVGQPIMEQYSFFAKDIRSTESK